MKTEAAYISVLDHVLHIRLTRMEARVLLASLSYHVGDADARREPLMADFMEALRDFIEDTAKTEAPQ